MTVYVLIRDEFGEGRSIVGIFDNYLKAMNARDKLELSSWSEHPIEEWDIE